MKHSILFLLTVLLFQVCRSQEHQLSPFSSSPISVNPAATGAFGNSNLRVFTGFDWEYYSKNYKGNFLHFAVDKTMINGAIGVGVEYNNTNGNTNYQNKFWYRYYHNDEFMFSGAFHKNLFNDNYKLSAGVQAGLTRDYFYLEGDTSLTNDPDYEKNIFYPDVNFGVLFAGNSKEKLLTPWFGISIVHVFKPDISHWGTEYSLPRRVMINTGADIHFNQEISISPLALYSIQDNYKILNLGVSAKMDRDKFSAMVGGLFRRSGFDSYKTNQFNLLIGVVFAGFDLRAEIQIHNQSINYQRMNGGIIGLSYTMPEVKR